MTVPYIPCLNCKHLFLNKKRKCKAFPDGIPQSILEGKNNHTEPLSEQNNKIVFEEVK